MFDFESYTYTVSDGKITITDFDTSYSGYVSIPSHINGYPVTEIGDNAFEDCKDLTGILIPEGVTHIGNSAFSHCREAEEISLPDSLLSIGNDAFLYCDSLKSVIIPENADDVGNGAFEKCYALENVTILFDVFLNM